LSRWDKFERAKVVKKHTHTRAISFHDTFARKRTRTNRSNAFYRSFAFAKFFHTLTRSRGLARIVLFETKKKDFSKSILLGNQTKPNPRVRRKGSTRATREHTERERKRKKEGTTRTGGFTGSLFRTSHVDFLRQFFFLMTIRSPFSDK